MIAMVVAALKAMADTKDVEYIYIFGSAAFASVLIAGEAYLTVEWSSDQGKELISSVLNIRFDSLHVYRAVIEARAVHSSE